jgi:hypothetical protein
MEESLELLGMKLRVAKKIAAIDMLRIANIFHLEKNNIYNLKIIF